MLNITHDKKKQKQLKINQNHQNITEKHWKSTIKYKQIENHKNLLNLSRNHKNTEKHKNLLKITMSFILESLTIR